MWCSSLSYLEEQPSRVTAPICGRLQLPPFSKARPATSRPPSAIRSSSSEAQFRHRLCSHRAPQRCVRDRRLPARTGGHAGYRGGSRSRRGRRRSFHLPGFAPPHYGRARHGQGSRSDQDASWRVRCVWRRRPIDTNEVQVVSCTSVIFAVGETVDKIL